MIRNEVKLIGRLTANPELKYTKHTNKLTNSLLITALFTDNGRDIFQKENCLIMKS